MPIKLNTASGGGVILQGANTASDKTITIPADDGTMIYANSSGNVGIGTSSPATRLHAQTTGADIEVRATTISSGNVRFGFDASGAFYNWIQTDRASGALQFAQGNNERMRIDSSGKLLVNTTSAVQTGTVSISYDHNTSIGLGVRSNVTFASTQVAFLNPNGVAGSIATNGSATAYNTSSDYRLKHDIQPMQNALAKVAALKPVTYKWNADNSAGEGFIAHELAEVVPGCVTGEKDAVDADGNPVYQGIDTSFLVATMTAAIQEQQAMIEELKAKVAALEAK